MDAPATRIIAIGYPDHRAFNVTEPDDTFLFPGADNPMLKYLIRTAKEYETNKANFAIPWLAVHAWHKGALQTLAHTSRPYDHVE
ncbi:hypothetical protein [Nocardia testacea]|uniref:hypothetical protein n=1 Tax=Nocardia testacea TaxID=248551 RepID=UPI0034077A11